MNILGIIVVFFGAILYVFRYSALKSLQNYKITKPEINFIYRLISLPIMFLILLIFQGFEFKLKPEFWIYGLLALVVNITYSLFQIHIFHKNKFSSVTTMEPLAIVFSGLLGFFLLSEPFPKTFLLSLLLITMAFIILASTDRDFLISKRSLLLIVIYNILTALIYYVNKRSISESDPFSFAFLMSVGLCISNYILSFISSKRLIIHIPKGVASNLVTLGILTGTSFAFVSFGYTLIPLSGVSAILAVVPFIALLVSKYKFNEEKLLPKLVASAIAFVGVLIMVLPR